MLLCQDIVDKIANTYLEYMRYNIDSTLCLPHKTYLNVNNVTFEVYVKEVFPNLTINYKTLFYDIHYLAPKHSKDHGRLFKQLQREYFRKKIYLYDETFINGGQFAIFIIDHRIKETVSPSCHDLNLLPFSLRKVQDPLDHCIVS